MENTKDISWLQSNYRSENVRIFDCRFKLDDPSYGKGMFEKGHIPGAVYFDLAKDLSGKVKEHGGRHPLPEIEDFVHKLEQAGVDNETTIIAYDNGEGAFSARCWWLLKYIGHEKAYILNKGYQGWKNNDLPISTKAANFPVKEYNPEVRKDMIATVDDVRKIVKKESEGILIDSRARDRYLGLTEPLDRIAGHIPGAVNHVWTEGLKEGRFLPAEEQQKRWNGLHQEQRLVVYCGSGVTATPNILSLLSAGYNNVRLYAGSYSDWVSYAEHEVEKQNEN